MKFRQKPKIYIKRPILIVIGIWWLFVWLGTFVSIYLWWFLISFVFTYIIADVLYDAVWKKVNPNTRTGIFATYIPVVVAGSFVAGIASVYSESTVSLFYSIIPSLPLILHRAIASVIGTSLILTMAWGRAGMIHENEKAKKMPFRKR